MEEPSPERRPSESYDIVVARSVYPRVRRVAIFALEIVPIIALGKFMAELAGVALWMPPEWRLVTNAFSTAVGFSCFRLARIAKRRSEPISATPEGGTGGDADARQRLRSRRRKFRHAWAQHSAGLAFWLLAASLILAQLLLERTTVVAWNPSPEDLHHLVSESDYPGYLDQDLIQLDPPFYVELVDADEEGRGVEPRGSVIFPLFFPWTEAGRRHMAEMQQDMDRERVRLAERTYAVDEYPTTTQDVLRGPERFGYWSTLVLFVVIHLLIIATASVAYGRSFDPVEELLT